MKDLIHCIKEYAEYIKSDDPISYKILFGFSILFYGVGGELLKLTVLTVILSI